MYSKGLLLLTKDSVIGDHCSCCKQQFLQLVVVGLV